MKLFFSLFFSSGGIKHINNSEIIGNLGDGFYATFEGILRPDWDYDVVYPRWRYVYQRHNWNQETQIAKTKFYDNENHAIEIGKYCRFGLGGRAVYSK